MTKCIFQDLSFGPFCHARLIRTGDKHREKLGEKKIKEKTPLKKAKLRTSYHACLFR